MPEPVSPDQTTSSPSAAKGHLTLVSNQPMPAASLDPAMPDFHAMAACCDLLETIADRLPRAYSPVACQRAITGLSAELPVFSSQACQILRDHRLMQQLDLDADAAGSMLVRLLEEDAGLACEIIAQLTPLAAGDAPENPEQLGYMLRCFFQGFRKTILIVAMALSCRDMDVRLFRRLMG